MVKGKKSANSSSSAWKCSCRLLPEERSTGLMEYMSGLANDIMLVAPPPGEDPNVQLVEGMLIDPAKEILFKLIHMVFREFGNSLCFKTLDEANIVVTYDGLVKIKKDNTKDATYERKEENVRALGNLIDRVVRACSYNYTWFRNNSELKYLLGQMRQYKVGRSTFLIKYPPCLVPLGNRPFYYVTMHDHFLEIVRWNDSAVFNRVMEGLDIPQNWFPLLQQNAYIHEFLKIGFYDPHGTKESTVPSIEPLKCMRNLPSHCREGAASGHHKNVAIYGINAPAPCAFTKEDLARATYAKMPMAMCSLARGLEVAGELQGLGTEKLFPGRLQIRDS